MAANGRTVKRILPVQLDDAEVAERAQELARAEIQRGQLQSDFTAAAEDWKEQKKLWESKLLTSSEACIRLGRVVKDREEEREVECVATVNNGQFTLARKDTGEVVLHRPATAEELQMRLPE